MGEISQERMIETKRQSISVKKEYTNQRILDIGGGGEGIISKVYGSDVVAIDNRKEELLELAGSSSLKIVMDASNMTFLDKQFDIATAFFTMMYMSLETVDKVINEAHRVLKTGGIFEVWDTILPAINGHKDVFVLQLDIDLDDHTISTGYGVMMDVVERTISSYETYLSKYFVVENIESTDDGLFHIVCRKVK